MALNLSFGMSFADLYDREGLVRLDKAFIDFLAMAEADLADLRKAHICSSRTGSRCSSTSRQITRSKASAGCSDASVTAPIVMRSRTSG